MLNSAWIVMTKWHSRSVCILFLHRWCRMSTFLMLIAGLALLIMVYKRYFPILGIPCKKVNLEQSNAFVLDIRDYNVDTNHKESDFRLPYAYLKRFIQEIPKQKLHVIASDRLELNLGLRYLLSKGYHVVGYQLSNCPCKNK